MEIMIIILLFFRVANTVWTNSNCFEGSIGNFTTGC